MRNLKKLLAVIVSICVLATFTVPAFAAETTATISGDAQIVADLGVLKGDTADGVTETYLAKGTTRLQAAILYLRLIGKEAAALAETSTDNFADAASVKWAGGKAVLAYLKANPDLGWQGVGAGKFDPNGKASAQMIYKVLLESLGYKQGTDFEWADTFTFAAEKGMSKVADVTSLTNDDMAIALVEALKANLKDGSKTLAADLVAKNIIDADAAAKAGLVNPAVALDVSSVEAIASTIVMVKLGTAATAADVAAATFSIKDEAGKDLAVSGASLYAEKEVRVVTAATTPIKYTLTYNETAYDYVGLPAETDKPEVISPAIPKTKNLVELTFNERVDKETATNIANYSINNSLTVTAAELQDGDKVVKLTTSDQTAGKLYTITVTNVKDLAGNVVNPDKDESKFGGLVDTTKPEVLGTAVPKSNIKVWATFSEEMDEASVETVANYTADNDLIITAAEYDNDTKTVKLITSSQISGKLYKITVANVQDLSGNVINSDKDEAKFGGVAVPSKGPQANNPAIALSNTSVQVNFNMGYSELDETSAENIANYSINDLTVTKAELQDDNSSVKLTTSAQTAGKLYTITMTGITNNFGKAIESDKDEVKFGGLKLDTEGPEVKSASPYKVGNDYFVDVLFNKKVEEKSAEIAANYYFGTSLGYAKSAVLGTDGVTVKVKTGDQGFNTLYTLVVSNVKSLDGVVVKSDKDEAKFTGMGTDSAPELDYALAKNIRTVVLYFKGTLTADNTASTGAAATARYTLYEGSTIKNIISKARYNDTAKSVTLYLSADLKAGTMYTVKFDNILENARGSEQTDSDKREADFAGIDTAFDFSIDYVMAVNDKTIDVYFTDEVGAGKVPTAANTYLKGGATGAVDALFVNATPVGNDTGESVAQLASNKSVVRITLGTAKLISGKVYELYFSEAGLDTKIMSVGGVGIKEDSSDKSVVASFAGSNEEIADAEIDYMMATDDKTMKVAFKTTVSLGTIDAAKRAKFIVTNDTTGDAFAGAGLSPVNIIEVDDTDGREYNLYFNAAMKSGRVYTLTIDGTANIANAAGIQNDDIDSSVAGSPDEHAVPKILSVDVNNDRDEITVKFNQKVTGLTPAANAVFAFSGAKFENGVDATFQAIAIAAVTDDDEVAITLASPLAGGQSPKIGFILANQFTDRNTAKNTVTGTDDYVQFTVPADATAAAAPIGDFLAATAASGTVTYAAAAGTVTVDGTVFTYDAGSNLGPLFTTSADLAADIDALASVSAVDAAGTITVTAATAGAAGNAIALVATSGTVSGAALTGGAADSITLTFAESMNKDYDTAAELGIAISATGVPTTLRSLGTSPTFTWNATGTVLTIVTGATSDIIAGDDLIGLTVPDATGNVTTVISTAAVDLL